VNPLCVKYWEFIADNLKEAGWSLGWVSAVDSNGRTIWIADAHRGDGKRFVVHAATERQSRDARTIPFIGLRSHRQLSPFLTSYLCHLNPGSGQERLFLSVLSSSLSDP